MEKLNRRQWLAHAATAGVAFSALPLLRAAPDEDEMVVIPAEAFLMGNTPEQVQKLAREYHVHPDWLGGEAPQRRLELAAFRMDKYPVTNRQFAAFCKATGHKPPFHFTQSEPPRELLDHPVVHVSRADALAYAKWSGKRLPTEAEWEKAARGTDGRLFPWGDKFDAQACQWDRGGVTPPSGTAPVTSHPRGASPYGVMDMAGNVLEWCADQPGAGSAFLKGGCWLTSLPLHLRCSAHGQSGFDNNQLGYIGFRCVKNA